MTLPMKKQRGGQRKSFNALVNRRGSRFRERANRRRGIPSRLPGSSSASSAKLASVFRASTRRPSVMEGSDSEFTGRAVCLPADDACPFAHCFGEVRRYHPEHDEFSVTLFDYDGEEETTRRVLATDVKASLVSWSDGPVSGRSRGSFVPLDLNAEYRLPYGRKVLWVLDVFSGTKSVHRGLMDVLRKYRDWTVIVVHLDMDPKRQPDVECDVRDWKEHLVDKWGFQPGDFDIIWESPECKFFSTANHPTKKQLAEAVELVSAGIDIIEFFNPVAFFIENPRGRLRHQEIMRNLIFFRLTCTYCHYSEDGLYKPTDIWTNVPNIRLDFCCSSNLCKWRSQGHDRHRVSSQRGPASNGTPGSPKDTALQVPKGLMVILMGAALSFVTEVQRAPLRVAKGPSRGRRKMLYLHAKQKR